MGIFENKIKKGNKMKLLFCKNCHDIFNLKVSIEKSCMCGKTKGMYIDKIHAQYSGEFAVLLGINNYSFLKAIQKLPDKNIGNVFEAFVISKNCETFVKKD